MRYIKAEEVLPQDVIILIQQYVDGVSIYIPRKEENRRQWGCGTSYREELSRRNAEIRVLRSSGVSISDLAQRYHLSPKTICRILRQEQTQGTR